MANEKPEVSTITLTPAVMQALRPAFEAMAQDPSAATRAIGRRVLKAHDAVQSGNPAYDIVAVPLIPSVANQLTVEFLLIEAHNAANYRGAPKPLPETPVTRLAQTIKTLTSRPN